jgi:nicotinamide phosphoribosyltransferase
MCSNFAVDGDERTFLKRLLTELYPNTSFSCVCDSYDYWNVVENILPSLKDEIMAHNGCFLVRGDSGDCVDVVTKTVFKLWELFGGTVNTKGYKVLDPHVKALYGDSITVERAEKIYQILMDNGFAASNVSLGVGSFSMHCIEEDGMLKPFTRDTFSSCIKACDAIMNGKEYPIFKDPKTDRESGENMKKSHKGCVRVFYDENGNLTCEDGLTYAEAQKDTLMDVIFRDGKLLKEFTLQEIRATLNDGKF